MKNIYFNKLKKKYTLNGYLNMDTCTGYNSDKQIYRILKENIPFSAMCDINRKFAYPCVIKPRGVY